jgi:hypothetical protein
MTRDLYSNFVTRSNFHDFADVSENAREVTYEYIRAVRFSGKHIAKCIDRRTDYVLQKKRVLVYE